MSRAEDAYLVAAALVADARLRYAESFLLYKARHATSDGQAHQQAIVATKDELTVLTARLEIARRNLDRG